MKKFTIEPYGFTLHFIVTRKEMVKVYGEVTGNTDWTADDCAGCAWQDGNDFYIGVFDDGVSCLDTLAHECQHLMLDICVYINYDPSKQQEPMAFLAGWLHHTLLFAHPKFKEAMNESVGTRSRNGGRRAPKSDGPHPQQ